MSDMTYSEPLPMGKRPSRAISAQPRQTPRRNVAPRTRTPKRRTPPPASKAGILFRPRIARACPNPALSTYGGRPSRLSAIARVARIAAKIAGVLVILAIIVLGTRSLSSAMASEATVSQAESSVSPLLKASTDPIDESERATLIDSLVASPADYTENVPEVLQGDAYPSGCEPAALASVLQSMGIDVSLEDMLAYLDYDPDFIDFVYHYAGDPAGSGSAWPPAMVDAANRYLDDAQTAENDTASAASNASGTPASDTSAGDEPNASANGASTSSASANSPSPKTAALQAVNISGASFSEVEQIIAAGYPVMAWTTTSMEDPEFSDYQIFGYQFVVNNHCVVVCGMADDESTVLVMDPLEGMVERDANNFARIYEERGGLAMVVAPTSTLS